MRQIRMCTLVVSVLTAVSATPLLFAEDQAFKNVQLWYSATGKLPHLDHSSASLIFDDSARRLKVKADKQPLDVGYEAVEKVIFEVTRHQRGGWGAAVLGGLAGALISSGQVNDYWCYMEYNLKGKSRPLLLEIDKGSSENVIGKMKEIFSERVQIPGFPLAALFDRKSLKDLNSKHSLRFHAKNRPLPEARPDKSLVVVVCPRIPGPGSGGFQIKLHANDRVVAVMTDGCYSFCHLDPGKYWLVCQAKALATGLELELEPGKEYYFLLDAISQGALYQLSMHTKELVMFHLNGTVYSEWQRKEQK